MREIQINCDVCHEEGRRTPAGVIAFAVRSVDPDGKVRMREGVIEQCAEHAGPLGALAFSDVEPHLMRKLEPQERAELMGKPVRSFEAAVPMSDVDRVNAVNALSNKDYVICRDCTPPKLLKKASRPSHAQSVHNGASVGSVYWDIPKTDELL